MCLGISAVVTQLLMLREALAVFGGNELIIGLLLGVWLLWTGIGALLGQRLAGGRAPGAWLVCLLFSIALMPTAQLIVLRLFRGALVPGTLPSLSVICVGAALVLAPYCLCSGMIFPLAAVLLSPRKDAGQVAHTYVFDTVGSILGGLLFSFVLVRFCTPFQTAAFLLYLSLAIVLVQTWRQHRIAAVAAVLVIAAFSVGTIRFNPEARTLSALVYGQPVLYHRTSFSGHIIVTGTDEQVTIYENGIPTGATGDPAAGEEIVHYALAQHTAPKKVLLVSGGLTGAVSEILKYPVERVDYVEPDPVMLDVTSRVIDLERDPRVQLVSGDPRRFLRHGDNRYDAILVNLSEPRTVHVNRFYTVEYFKEVRRALRDDGVFSFTFPGLENYAGRETRLLLSSVYASLTSVFPDVLIVPGRRQVFVAAGPQRPLDIGIPQRLRTLGIPTVYVRDDYFRAKTRPDRLSQAQEAVSMPAPLNRDFQPVTCYVHLKYWLRQSQSNLVLPLTAIAGIAILLITLLYRQRRVVTAAVAASGFAAMGLKMVLLIIFQSYSGYVYHHISLLIAVFMAGAAAGAACGRWLRTAPGPVFRRLDIGLALIALGLCTLTAAAPSLPAALVTVVIVPLLLALAGGVVGCQFVLASRLVFTGVGNTAAQLFLLDMLGACLGALVISTYLIPLGGLVTTCIVLGAVKGVTALWLLRAAPAALTEPAKATVPEVIPPAAMPGGGGGRRRQVFATFGVIVVVFVVTGILLGWERTQPWAYAMSFHPVYQGMLLFLLFWGVFSALDLKRLPNRNWASWRLGRLTVFQWLNYVVFAVAVFFPIFRCYFKVPYLFCHVCPRKCIFGVIRPFIIPGVLLMNIRKRHWCYHGCPIGAVLDCEARVSRQRWRSLGFLRGLFSLAVLALIVYVYFRVRDDFYSGPITDNWYEALFKNSYSVTASVVAISVLVLILGFLWVRAFCDLICPVGTVSEFLLRREQHARAKPGPASPASAPEEPGQFNSNLEDRPSP
jgi:spermidine synthase